MIPTCVGLLDQAVSEKKIF